MEFMIFDFIMDDPYLLLVNKEKKLGRLYVPRDLVYPVVLCDIMDDKKFLRKKAARELEKMFFHAARDGIELVAVSGFRSYDRQKEIYDTSIRKKGKEYTDKYIAKPGTSEHQTGLAMDISSSEINYELEEEFENTKAGIWMRYNAWHFGYILRYPKGKSCITGYEYEPWHYRYVGKRTANLIHENDITLEEFIKAFTLIKQ